jgi:ATP-dependent Clp protease ATP-binding subunit ClpC
MTSNIGQELIQQQGSLGFKAQRQNSTYTQMKEKLMDQVKKSFRPEFLNRIDDIIVFNPLDKQDILSIVDMELQPITKRLLQQGIALGVTKKAKEYIAEKGFDVNFGARPLKRAIQKYAQDPLSIRLLEGKLKAADKVILDIGSADKLVFR